MQKENLERHVVEGRPNGFQKQTHHFSTGRTARWGVNSRQSYERVGLREATTGAEGKVRELAEAEQLLAERNDPVDAFRVEVDAALFVFPDIVAHVGTAEAFLPNGLEFCAHDALDLVGGHSCADLGQIVEPAGAVHIGHGGLLTGRK